MLRWTKIKKLKAALAAALMITCFSIPSTWASSQERTSGDRPPAGPGGRPPGARAAELPPRNGSKYFTDLNASTAAINAYVDDLYDRNLVTDPRGDKTFHPLAPLTRADLAVFLNLKYRFAGTGAGYDDVAPEAYCYDAVSRGKANKIFEDTPAFDPDRPVTREEFALWIFRCEIRNGMPRFMVSSDVSGFGDGPELPQELKKAVATLAGLGIVCADETGNFTPTGIITRAQAVMPLYALSFLGCPPAGAGRPGGPPPGGPGARAGRPGPPGSGGGPGGPNPGGSHGNPGGSHGNPEGSHGSFASLVAGDLSGKSFASSGDNENALRAQGGIQAALTEVFVNKTGGQASGGDASNFYGSNAAFLVMGGAQVTLKNSRISSSALGGNGIFSYGRGTKVIVDNCTISTSRGSSGGVMVTGGGAMAVTRSRIETQGRSSAALRSDRGGGSLTVDGGTYIAHGEGSPAIYSTADIKVSGATLTATASEAVVIEGKNSVALKDCIVSGNMIRDNVQNLQNVMIYQSMSGDAEQGRSAFDMEGGSLTSGSGDMFYVTNTACNIRLRAVTLTLSNDIVLKVVGNDARNGWGTPGKNGGQCRFTAEDQQISGRIIVDDISSLNLALARGSQFTGTINANGAGGSVALAMDKTSQWTLTGDSHVSSLTGETGGIDTNGFTLYVNQIPFDGIGSTARAD